MAFTSHSHRPTGLLHAKASMPVATVNLSTEQGVTLSLPVTHSSLLLRGSFSETLAAHTSSFLVPIGIPGGHPRSH